MIYSRLHILLLASLLSFCLSGQNIIKVDREAPEVILSRYDSDNGLLQNTVHHLAFDNQDFLWIITEKGMSRFDGTNFQHHLMKVAAGKLEDEDQRFNFLMPQGDRLLINRQDNYFIRDGKMHFDSLKGFEPEGMFGFRLHHVSEKDLDSVNAPALNSIQKSVYPFENKLKTLFLIDNTSIYGANDQGGLDYYENGKIQSSIAKEYPYQHKRPGTGFDQGYLRGVFNYYNRYFVIGESLFFLSPENHIREYRKGLLYKEYTLDADIGQTRVIWQYGTDPIIYAGKSLYRLNTDLKDYRLESLIELPEGNPQCAISYDNGRVLFVGTTINGLYKIERPYFQSLYLESAGMRNNDRTIHEIGQDSIISRKCVFYAPGVLADKKNAVDALPIRDKSKLYSLKRFLGSLDPVGSHFGPDSEPRWWGGNYLNDKFDSTWFAGRDGVIQLINEKPHVLVLDTSSEIKRYRGAHYNPFDHSIWRAFHNQTDIYDISSGQLTAMKALKGHDLHNVYFENKSRTWFCLIGEGIASWDGDSLTHYPLDKKQVLNSCHAIVEDDEGFFWVSSDRGLVKVSKAELLAYKEDPNRTVHYHYFEKKLGFLTNEFNGQGFPCGLKMSSGKIVFPSLKGMVMFDPKEVPIPTSQSELLIDQIRIDGRDTIIKAGSHLSQGFEQLDFEIVYSFYGNKENLLLEYQLKGRHQKWHTLPANNVITIANLNYGDYELMVRRKNGFGVDDYSYLNFAFHVKPTLYQTAKFKISASLLALLILVGIFWFNNWSAKQKRLRLEQIIAEKTQDQILLNEELKLNLAKVRASEEEQRKTTEMKDRFMAIYTHDVRGPLRFIRTITKSSLKRLNDIELEELRQRLEDIDISTHRVFLLTERMFLWLRGQKNDFPLKYEVFSLFKMVNSLIGDFQEQAASKGIRIISEIEPEIQPNSEKNVLSIIISNLLDNAIKFSKNGAIVVSALELNDTYLICIKDSGIGMSKDRILEVTSNKYQSDEGTDGERGTGFGLRTIRELLSMINGQMEIESEPGKGTTFSIYIKKA